MSASFAAAAAWGIVALAAFIGWGDAIGKWLFRGRRADAGLQAVWGMSFAILAGGTACLFHIGSKTMIFAFVAIGAALFVVERRAFARRFDTGTLKPSAPLILLILCILLALVQYLLSIGNLRFNPNDDLVAYFPFAKQILQQGTLFDPFSTRRVMSFGGQSFLHAIVLAGSPAFRLHQLDAGICVLIAVLLVIGDRKADRPAWPELLALLLLLTLPDVRINTYPEMSGVVVFYGLYRTLVWLEDDKESRAIPNAAIVALLAAAACALRSNYIAAAVPLLAISYGHVAWKERRIGEALRCIAFSVLFLAPWLLMSWRSSGTPLFPLIHGNFNDTFPMLQDPRNWRQQLIDLIDTMRGNRVLSAFPLFVLAGFLLPDRGSRKPMRALLISSLIGWAVLISALASDVPNFLRYVYAFMVAVALAVIAASTIDVQGVARKLGQAIAGLAALVQLFLVAPEVMISHGYAVRTLPRLARSVLTTPDKMPTTRRYAALQSRVPPGKPLLVQVDYPFLFDFARNDIYNVDTAAASSPPPGFPYFQGAQRVADYLRGASIRYVAFVRPEHALELFRRDVWVRQGKGAHFLWRAQAPLYLDVFDNLERLAASHARLYDDGSLVLVDLARPTKAAASPPPE